MYSSIREVDRIRWFHRLLLFVGGMTLTLISAYWLRWESLAWNTTKTTTTTVLSIFWIIVGPTFAIASMWPVTQYFGTVEIVPWLAVGQDEQEQLCQGCQTVGSLELFHQRSLLTRCASHTTSKAAEKEQYWTHCQVCGMVGLPHQSLGTKDPDGLDVELSLCKSPTDDTSALEDPVLKASAILNSVNRKREQTRGDYDEVVPADNTSLEDAVETPKESSANKKLALDDFYESVQQEERVEMERMACRVSHQESFEPLGFGILV